jgi:hypothetical protein
MTTHTVIASLVLLLMWPEQHTASPVPASEREAIEKSVLEISDGMTKAGEARDIDRLFTFMLENDKGSIVQNGRIFLTRSEALQVTKQNTSFVSFIRYTWKQRHVTVVSPTVALLVAEGESAVTTAQGRSYTAPFAQTIVFVLTDGNWKALHAHQSSPRN